MHSRPEQQDKQRQRAAAPGRVPLPSRPQRATAVSASSLAASRERLAPAGPVAAAALWGGAVGSYLGCMGRIILLVIAALVVFIIVTWIVHALMFFFWIALLAMAGFSLVRLAMWSSARR